jgi:serine/tyrosine/threonine adenylyltransferase
MRRAKSYRDYPESLSHPRQQRRIASTDPAARRGIRGQQTPATAHAAVIAKLDPMDIALQADVAEPASVEAGSAWPNRFLELGPAFFTTLPAERLPEPHWVARSDACAELLGLPVDWWQRPDLNALDVFSGNTLWPGMQTLASVYSGHQFGVWAGQLGDGRALWLGEMATPNGPMELQLKGAGRTPYSRMGDGRAVLRSSIREFLCSEAMQGLNIPTTRALCVTGSALPVRREQIETAAVLTRVAPSFIRFGHFEHFSHHDQHAALKELVDFVIEHHYPTCLDAAQPVVALLETVTRRTAELMAAWQSVGFCHGVMNTDNMSVLGLTIDYGPFGFLDAFDPGQICNHSDHQGRYAWARQPNVGFWNLHALAQALLPLIGDSDLALAALETYKAAYAHSMLQRWSAKIGLQTRHADDQTLIDDLLKRMAADKADFTISFRRLAAFDGAPGASNDTLRDLFLDREAFDAWGLRYAERLRSEASIDAERALRMNLVNPKFVLRNHMAEVAIQNAQAGDFAEVDRLLKVLQRPFDEQPAGATAADAGFPPEWAQTIEVSCSS